MKLICDAKNTFSGTVKVENVRSSYGRTKERLAFQERLRQAGVSLMGEWGRLLSRLLRCSLENSIQPGLSIC